MTRRSLSLLSAVLVLIAASLACGFGDETDQPDGRVPTPTDRLEPTLTQESAAPTSTTGAEPTPTTEIFPTPTFQGMGDIEDYDPGEVVLAGSLAITLNSAQIAGGLLQANFTITNLTSESVSFNPYASLRGRNVLGFDLLQDEANCPAPILVYSSIASGGSLTGNICWTGLSDDEAEIIYSPIVTGQGFVAVSDPIARWEVGH